MDLQYSCPSGYKCSKPESESGEEDRWICSIVAGRSIVAGPVHVHRKHNFYRAACNADAV